MGENRTFPHFGRAQVGVDFALLDLPVITEHCVLICCSMRMLGSCPGGMATGVLQRGHDGAMRSCLAASYLSHWCAVGRKCSPQKACAQCWHLKGRKSTTRQEGAEHCLPMSRSCWSRSGVADPDMVDRGVARGWGIVEVGCTESAAMIEVVVVV